MVTHLPSFRALKALEAVVRQRNIVKAASELGVTPGAVTKQLQNLQAELGAPLFKESHRLQPTEIAVELAYVIGRSITQLQDAWNEAAHQTDSHILTLVANASFCMYWLLPRVPAAQTALRGRAVRAMALHTTDDWWQLSADLAVLRHNKVPTGWIKQKVCSERLTLLAAPQLADSIARGGLATLANQTFLVAETRDGELENWLTEAGLSSGIKRRRCLHFYMALEGALSGQGVVVGPMGLVGDLVSDGHLAFPLPEIQVEGTSITGAYNPVTCDERTGQRLLAWLNTELNLSCRTPVSRLSSPPIRITEP